MSVEKIMFSLPTSYNLKLIAGKNGLGNTVDWVNLVEEDEISSPVIENEIVFTSCIKNAYSHYLLNFVKNLKNCNCAALVVKIGIYIEAIPDEVIDFCNENKIPLYTIPNCSSILKITYDISHRMIWEEKKRASVNEAIQNIILENMDIRECLSDLETYNFSSTSIYCPVIVEFEDYIGEYSTSFKTLEIHCTKIADNISNGYAYFTYKNKYFIFVLVDCTTKMLKDFMFQLNLKLLFPSIKNYVYVGSNKENVYMLAQNFKRAMSLTNIARTQTNSIVYYDNLDIFKLFAEISNMEILKEFHHNVLELLEDYDSKNGTSLLSVLKTYLEHNCNLQLVAEKHFLHRNTVNKQLVKIKKITNIDPISVEGKMKFMLAFYIKQFINL